MSKPLSLPRHLILKKPADFRMMYRKGHRAKGKNIVLIYLGTRNSQISVGFSTGKKLRRAIDRNRARRLMREVFRLHQNEVKRGFNYLFVFNGPVKGWNYQKAEKEIINLLQSEDLFKK